MENVSKDHAKLVSSKFYTGKVKAKKVFLNLHHLGHLKPFGTILVNEKKRSGLNLSHVKKYHTRDLEEQRRRTQHNASVSGVVAGTKIEGTN